MRNSSGLIALLLIVAILLMPSENTPAIEQTLLSAQTVCADNTMQSGTLPQEDNENDTATIIAVVIIVIIIIFFIGSIANTETG